MAKSKGPFQKGIFTTSVILPKNTLAEGLHLVSVAIVSYDPFLVHLHELESISFFIVDSFSGTSVRGDYGGHFPGVIRPLLQWKSIEQISI